MGVFNITKCINELLGELLGWNMKLTISVDFLFLPMKMVIAHGLI